MLSPGTRHYLAETSYTKDGVVEKLIKVYIISKQLSCLHTTELQPQCLMRHQQHQIFSVFHRCWKDITNNLIFISRNYGFSSINQMYDSYTTKLSNLFYTLDQAIKNVYLKNFQKYIQDKVKKIMKKYISIRNYHFKITSSQLQ